MKNLFAILALSLLGGGCACSCSVFQTPVVAADSVIEQKEITPPSLEYVIMYKQYREAAAQVPLDTTALEASLAQEQIPVRELSQLLILLPVLRSDISSDATLTAGFKERHLALIDTVILTLSNYLK